MNHESYVSILGRQPLLGVAELERRFGSDAVTPISDTIALIQTDKPVDITVLGGSVKIARVTQQTASNGWLGVSKQAVAYLARELAGASGKTTLGISAYGFKVSPRDVQKTGLVVKARLKNSPGSLRLIPNNELALSSAQVFHNKLAQGGNKRELVLVSGDNSHGYIAETIGVQDIDAYTLRDRGRPKRDPLNGMLPPKLAQTIINLAGATPGSTLWDPFCGTGVVLQEALLMGINAYGSDLNPKMIEFSQANLEWLDQKYNLGQTRNTSAKPWYALRAGDATTITIATAGSEPVQSVASETFLGEPMAQPPTPEKLTRIMEKCETIIRGFLVNAAAQLEPGTPLCIAVPAWRIEGVIKHLPVVDDLEELGYNWIDFKHVSRSDLLYYREDQIVARELLVMTKR